MTAPRLQSSRRKVRGVVPSAQNPGGVRKDSRQSPKGFQSPRSPRGLRDGYGIGSSRGKGAGKGRPPTPRVPTDTRQTDEAVRAWSAVLDRIATGWDRNTVELWIAPLSLAGESADRLAIEGPETIVGWVRRRYGAALGEVVRDVTGYRGLWIGVQADPDSPIDDGAF